MVQVQRNGEESGLGEPVGLIAVILRHAARIVEYDDPRRAFGRGRDGKVGRHHAMLERDEDVRHVGHLLDVPEQEHQLDEEDDHHHRLQNEGPALVKLVHHKLV